MLLISQIQADISISVYWVLVQFIPELTCSLHYLCVAINLVEDVRHRGVINYFSLIQSMVPILHSFWNKFSWIKDIIFFVNVVQECR